MNSNFVRTGIILGLLALAGCQKKDEPAAVAPVVKAEPPKPAPPKPVTVEVVGEKERSAHFTTVTRELELGGTLYAYVDIDGDVQKFAGALQGYVRQAAAAQPMFAQYAKDYGPAFTALGLDDIKAMGLSSVPDGDGYFRNRVFLYTPGKRHGLLAGLGGKPAPFARLNLAPADTDFYAESEVDLPEVYAAVRDVVGKVGGEQNATKMEENLKKAGESAALSVLSIIQDWKGHMAVVERFDREKTAKLTPAGPTIPAFSFLVSIDGLAPALKDALAKSQELSMRQKDTLTIYEPKQPLPVEFLKPVIVIDGSTLLLASSEAFFDECRQVKSGLADQADFQKAIARVGKEGNGLVYVTPGFFKRIHDIETLNPQVPPQLKQSITWMMANIPQPDRPLVTVRTNLPDGILFRSYMNRSLKQDVAMVAFYNPITVGVLAAMAIPAFQKVRTASQEKTVMNNLRQLAAATDQYCLENGVTTATYDQLVGPDKYVRRITPVAGENYRSLVFKQGEPLSVQLLSGQVVTYTP